MTTTTVGVALYQYVDAPTVLAEAELAERLGYARVWMGDSQVLWREPYVLLGAAAVRTSHVGLGVAVTNPVTRHATVTAGALATLQELSGGRGLLGVGSGFSAVKTAGLRPSNRAELRSFIELVRALCAGRTVTLDDDATRLAYGAPELCPPVLIGAKGPRMLELAGEVADGVIVVGCPTGHGMLDTVLEHVRAGQGRRERPSNRFMTCLAVAAAVHDDRSRALDAVRPHVARGLLDPHFPLSDRARDMSERMRAVYDVNEHLHPRARHAAAIPDDLVVEFAIAGTPQECRERLSSLLGRGIHEISIRPYPIDGEPRARTLERFATQVMHPLLG